MVLKMVEKKKLCLTVKNLTKSYILSDGTPITALDNVSFELYENETLGIIGRSGGGKTTLIRILRGIESFDSGEFSAGDLLITPKTSGDAIRRLKQITAIHLQRSFALWADTVLVNVMRRLNALETGDETADLPEETFSEYDAMKEKALELLKAVELEQKADHVAHTLSGGEKQRLQLARQLAIAKNLKILLLDEPLTMSGPDTKSHSLDFIKNIQKQYNLSCLVSSHYPKLLLNLVDRLILLEKGQIKAIGSPQEIIDGFLQGREDLIPLKELETREVKIKINNLTREYYTSDLKLTFRLEKFNLEIYKGEILGIIGPSGVGKTVFLQLLTGIDLPKEGEVLYFLESGESKERAGDESDKSGEKSEEGEEQGEGEESEDLTKGVNICQLGMSSIRARGQVAYVRQELALTYNALVKDLAANVLGIKGESAIAAARKRARELGIKEQIVDFVHRLGDLPDTEVNEKLEKLGLEKEVIHDLFPIPPWSAIAEIVVPIFEQVGLSPEILERKSQELSGGESVRVALALALLSGPKVLILDEIGGDIDPLTLRSIRNLLVAINSQFNTTIICASHNMDFIEELAHRILYLKETKIVKIGDPKEVCNLFLTDFQGI
ncbi:MAG: ATP-binding cassette domain-containing protein [Candidatus Helarchaeota archaeon]|nr:ATP-binding cassette domain-containing protein [Candidatus Helarchaeota archaeon]